MHVQEMQDSSKQAGPLRRRAALTAAQWTSSLRQPDRPPAYRAALLLMASDDFVIRMAGVSLLSVSFLVVPASPGMPDKSPTGLLQQFMMRSWGLRTVRGPSYLPPTAAASLSTNWLWLFRLW